MNGITDPKDLPITIFDTLPTEYMAEFEKDKWRNLVILFVIGAVVVYYVMK